MASPDYIGNTGLRTWLPAIDNRHPFLPGSEMIGRLFRLFLLLAVLALIVRWLLNHRQRQTIREFVRTLAIALLLSSLLMLGLSLAGIRL